MKVNRILHCVNSLDAADGGPARSVPALASAQADCGADVRLWSAHAPTIDLAEYSGVHFVHGDLSQALPNGWMPDLIHDHGLWLPSNHASARFGRHHRIPRIVSPRGMLQPWCLQHRRLKKQIAWRLYQHRDLRSAECLHATSAAEADQIRRLGFDQPIVRLPNGVRLPAVRRADEAARRASRRALREVLFLGRVHPVKGLDNLVTAWSKVSRDGWRLRIVGSDEDGYGTTVSRRIRDLALSDSVSVEGPVQGTDKWNQMAQADVFVLPSFSENFGIVVAEALAAGTPVITTTGTPWSDLPQQGSGWWVEPNADALADALRKAMVTPVAELEAMGQRGRNWVRDEFSWPQIGQRMLDACQHLFDDAWESGWLQRVQRNAA